MSHPTKMNTGKAGKATGEAATGLALADMENTFQKIYRQVKKIPAGKVATYGQIAMMAGNPHLSQIVGYALHANPDPSTIPCHRIVNRFGKISKAFVFGGENRQRELLMAEGVTFIDDSTVDLKKHIYSETLEDVDG